MSERVQIYTDGGCSPNPGQGAWAALLRMRGVEKEICGYEAETTNNRMELSAAIFALAALTRSCEVDLWTDSQYLRMGITEWLANWVRKGWRTAGGKAVQNQDLWEKLQALNQQHRVQWHWVKGHSGHADNERVDQLVRLCMESKGTIKQAIHRASDPA